MAAIRSSETADALLRVLSAIVDCNATTIPCRANTSMMPSAAASSFSSIHHTSGLVTSQELAASAKSFLRVLPGAGSAHATHLRHSRKSPTPHQLKSTAATLILGVSPTRNAPIELSLRAEVHGSDHIWHTFTSTKGFCEKGAVLCRRSVFAAERRRTQQQWHIDVMVTIYSFAQIARNDGEGSWCE